MTFTKAELATALKTVMELSASEKPEAVIFWCKEGGERVATMKRAFEPCEGCDCGWAKLLQVSGVSEIRDQKK